MGRLRPKIPMLKTPTPRLRFKIPIIKDKSLRIDAPIGGALLRKIKGTRGTQDR